MAASSAQISRAILRSVRLTFGQKRTIWEPIRSDVPTQAVLEKLIACVEELVGAAFDADIRIAPPTQHEADQLLTEAYLELVPFVRDRLIVKEAPDAGAE